MWGISRAKTGLFMSITRPEEASEAARQHVAADGEFLDRHGEPHRGEEWEKLREGDLQLDAGQGCAEAVARTMAEWW
ncbi:hypothetical protein GCM10010271_71130 [Streptomyces kurssanovii]|nr:hypothetical protein GCM10010271_71130 [Streptomyces kurssanovii]